MEMDQWKYNKIVRPRFPSLEEIYSMKTPSMVIDWTFNVSSMTLPRNAGKSIIRDAAAIKIDFGKP